jgi:hypothetical protein
MKEKIELDPEFFRARRPKINMAYDAGIIIEDISNIMYRLYEDPETYRFILEQKQTENPDT